MAVVFRSHSFVLCSCFSLGVMVMLLDYFQQRRNICALPNGGLDVRIIRRTTPQLTSITLKPHLPLWRPQICFLKQEFIQENETIIVQSRLDSEIRPLNRVV